jgi:hypothetical protein
MEFGKRFPSCDTSNAPGISPVQDPGTLNRVKKPIPLLDTKHFIYAQFSSPKLVQIQ